MHASRRIALVAACPFPSPQGSQVFVGQMAKRLAAAGHDVHLLTYGQGAEQSGHGYRHHRIARLPGDDALRSGPALMKPILDAMLTRRLARLVREERIEIIHAHNYEAAVAAIAARAVTRVPVVYHSHNLMGDELETYFKTPLAKRLAALAGRALDRTVPSKADRVIALCEWSAARLREAGCEAARISVIPPAVEDEGPIVAGAGARASFGISEHAFVVVYSGNLDAYQNLPLLLRAIELVRGREGPRSAPVHLLMVTHAAREARERVASPGLEGRLHLIEARGHAEARRALGISDIAALPRRLGSGYPVKLLNYMSAAKAVVTAGCGSKVLRSGVDGIVVADDDPAQLADAIELCREDPARRAALGQAARRSYLESLTWEQVLPRIEDVYAGLRDPDGRRDGP